MEISNYKNGSVHVVRLKGRLNLGQAVDDLRRQTDQLIGSGDVCIVLNMAEVPIVDSSGIGLMVRMLTSTKQRGGGLKLVNPTKLTAQSLKMVGLAPLFDVFDSEDAAIKSFA